MVVVCRQQGIRLDLWAQAVGRCLAQAGWAAALVVLMGASPGFARLTAVPATAPASPPTATDRDGPVYPISRFDLAYIRQDPAQPPLDQVAQTPVTLTPTATGWVAPRPGLPVDTRAVAAWATGQTQAFHASAVQVILERLRDYYTSRHYLGIFVAPDPLQIDRQGRDLRAPGHTALRLIITMGAVQKIRTLSYGERFPTTQRVDNPADARIIRHSPVQPYQPGDKQSHDLVQQNVLDDYALLMSRHPGRRVDVSLSPAPELGGVALDYLVTETKPWLVYGQLSNTGTRNTNTLREQFGLRDYQLTNHDDILALDYATTGFEKTHSVSTSYQAPLLDSDHVRWKVFGDWSQYTASDIGLTSNTFSGDSWDAGAELRANVYQAGPLFVDLLAGARFESIATSNTLPGSLPGGADFFIPYVGARAERLTDWNSFRAALTAEVQSTALDGLDAAQLSHLGRPDVDTDWWILRWDISQSLFIEPLLDRDAFDHPAEHPHATLAHELWFNLRGQTSFGQRIIPQFEMVAGGLYTVRGYPESIVAGDDAIIGTAEYRFHLPRALPLEPEPRHLFGQPFRFAPQQTYGPVDWDLIPHAFLDAAYVHAHAGAGLPTEDQTLLGMGLGFEVRYKRNLTFHLDWGVAMEAVPGLVNSGSQQIHFVLTVLY